MFMLALYFFLTLFFLIVCAVPLSKIYICFVKILAQQGVLLQNLVLPITFCLLSALLG